MALFPCVLFCILSAVVKSFGPPVNEYQTSLSIITLPWLHITVNEWRDSNKGEGNGGFPMLSVQSKYSKKKTGKKQIQTCFWIFYQLRSCWQDSSTKLPSQSFSSSNSVLLNGFHVKLFPWLPFRTSIILPPKKTEFSIPPIKINLCHL